MRTRNARAFGVLGACLALTLAVVPIAHAQDGDKDAPRYKVDPFWPKRLPNNWIMGQVGGLTVDDHDHIWVLQRPLSATPDELGAEQIPARSVCCNNTPAVLEFDIAGNLVK
jgi:hypothetical protein